MAHRTSPPTSSWRRALLALATGLVLALGAVTPHGLTAEHADSPISIELDRSARHPDQPAHMEASAIEVHPGCPACLLQLQTASVLVDLRAALPRPASRDAAAPTTEQAGSKPAPRLGPARAPPAVSPLSA
ncbi:MAG TPA: hypothetical protein VF756_15655 [Thermoanaerobaculia bacterium]